MEPRSRVFRGSARGCRRVVKLAEMPRRDFCLTNHVVDSTRGTDLTAGTDFTLVYGEGIEL